MTQSLVIVRFGAWLHVTSEASSALFFSSQVDISEITGGACSGFGHLGERKDQRRFVRLGFALIGSFVATMEGCPPFLGSGALVDGPGWRR